EERARRALGRYREENPNRFRVPAASSAAGESCRIDDPPSRPARRFPPPPGVPPWGRSAFRLIPAGRVGRRNALEPCHAVLVDGGDETAAYPHMREALFPKLQKCSTRDLQPLK